MENYALMSVRFLPHTADIKFIATAQTQSDLFDVCARAVAGYVLGVKRTPRATKHRRISLKGRNNEALLYSFLEEILYLIEVKQILVTEAKLSFSEEKLSGTIGYVPLGERRNTLRSIKAPTFAEMYVKKVKGMWKAQVVLDV